MSLWSRYRKAVLYVAILLMTIAAAHRLTNEFYRLLSEQGFTGAVDLKLRIKEVHRWFAGQPVYDDISAIYPPATYAMLWPVLGWPSVEAARWIWAVTSVFALAWLTRIIIRESGATGRWEQVLVALLPLSIYPTGLVIGNGQLLVHLLPVILCGLLLLPDKSGNWKNDLLLGVLILIPLAKLTVSIPFFWMALLVGRSLRPAFLAMIFYAALTLFAVTFQPTALFKLLQEWLERSTETVVIVKGGYANVHTWLIALGLEKIILPVSLILLFALGAWIYYYRRSDVWFLLGVSAVVARFWSYHLLYDDLLMLVPMITLFRCTKDGAKGAGIVLAITLTSLLAPAQTMNWPSPCDILFQTWQTIVWLLALSFLLFQTRRKHRLALPL